jgi:FkbM family methyltransferase
VTNLQNGLVLNVRGGARLCVPAAIDQITSYVFLEQEDWFEDEIRFVRRWLRPGMRTIDVGASFGAYTLSMARAVGRDGRVWAFEPTPDVAAHLRRSLELNACDHVVLSPAAISDREGAVTLTARAQSEANLIAPGAEASGSTFQANAMTLDRLAADLRWEDIDFIKVDVEGHEYQVIRGGADFFASNSPLIMFEVRAHTEVDLRVLEPLADLGYEFYRLLPGPLVLTPFDELESVDPFLLNLFACKSDRAAKLAAEGLLAGSDSAELAKPAKEAWDGYVRATPYARDLASQWPEKAGFFSAFDRKTYFEGLAAFACSQQAMLDADARVGFLVHAYQCLAEALDAADTLSRRMSCARVAWELGWRITAATTLAPAVARVESEGASELAVPFLAPSPRYERLAPGERPVDWLKCAVVEPVSRLTCFSSIYGAAGSLALLDLIKHLPHRSAEVDRSRQLCRMYLGMQKTPEPVPELCRLSEENLNPQLWSGADRTVLITPGRG